MSAELPGLYRLERAAIETALATLVRAFAHDPVLSAVFPTKEERQRIARHYFGVPLHYGLRYGEVYAPSERVEGVAVWLPSSVHPFTTWRLLRAVPLRTLLGFGRHGGQQLAPIGDFLDAAHARLAPEPHRFLQVIGVDPAHQGQGYASRLLRPMLAHCDEERLPCYLEALKAENASLYEHFGFQTVESGTIPQTSLPYWAMLRAPAGD